MGLRKGLKMEINKPEDLAKLENGNKLLLLKIMFPNGFVFVPRMSDDEIHITAFTPQMDKPLLIVEKTVKALLDGSEGFHTR